MEFSLGFELQKLLGCVKEEPSDKPKEQYSCPKCQKTFISEVSLSKHKKFVHELTKTTEHKFKCKLCSKLYSKRHHLETHFKSKHEGFRYKCSDCGKQYTNPGNLYRHIRSVHQGVRKLVTCDKCQKTFRKSSLQRHIRSIHQDIQDLFTCDKCQKSFTRSDTLKIHIRRCQPQKCD